MTDWADDLAGQVALVTGGASGIGFAIANTLLGQGMKVAIADVDSTSLEAAAARLAANGGVIIPLELDVRDPDAWTAAVQETEEVLGPLAVLCNNAGVGLPSAPTDEIAPAAWRHVIGVNLEGVYLGSRAVLPLMKQRRRGHIVNTSSILGLFPRAHNAAYVASKFAVVGFSEALRAELAPHGIGVSVLLPGLVQTAQMASAEKRGAVQAVADSKQKPAGISAESVGHVVLDAIRHNRLYALTHRSYLPIVADRCRRLAQAFADAEDNGASEDIDYLGGDSLALS